MGRPKHPDWLPQGWRVAHKVRCFGRKDKYYINLSNGLTFNSKPEVLRYLESSEERWKPKKPNKIGIEKVVAENLPPGWIKEIRTKRIRGKLRSDAYYIDPESGHHFRSMLEVLRHLKSNDEEECNISMELGDHSQSSSAEAKGQMSIDQNGDKKLTRHESATSGSTLDTDVDENMPDDNSLEQREDDSDKLTLANIAKQHRYRTKKINRLGDEKVDESANVDQTLKSGPNVAALKDAEKLVLEQSEREDDSVVGNLPEKPTPANEKKRKNGGRRRSTRLANSEVKDNVTKDLSLQSGLEAVAEKDNNLPENNGLNESEKENSCVIEGRQKPNLASENKRKASNSKQASDLPRRTSKRLARLDANPLMEAKTSNESGASASPSDEPEIDTATELGRRENPTSNKEKKAIINETTSSLKEPKGVVDVECNKDQKEIKAIINETPSSLEEPKGVVDVECNKDQKDEQPLDSCLKELLMDPCIEFAIKTLTGAIPIEAAAGNQTGTSSSIMPSGDLWSDPSFQFAVKTLKGEEATNNGSQFEMSFKKPQSSSGVGGMKNPSFVSFSQFNGIKNPWLRQQGGSSQNPVDTSGFQGRKGNFI